MMHLNKINPKARNPGRDSALAAAQAVDGIAVFPTGLRPGETDFNDLHRRQGLDAVRNLIEQAIAGNQGRAESAAEPVETASEVEIEHDEERRADDRFSVSERGVFHHGVDREGRPTKPEWICSTLRVVAQTRDVDGNGWGLLLKFVDPLGKEKSWSMPARLLAGDAAELRAALLNMGLRIAPTPRAKSLLTTYLLSRNPARFVTCTEKIGWHGKSYILPHRVFGGEADDLVYQTDGPPQDDYKVRGTAQAWRERIGAACSGNSRLILSVCAALAGPLLKPAGIDGLGVHIRGHSSTGKTSSARTAVSVWGAPDSMLTWHATKNGTEAVAAARNDNVVVLNDSEQANPQEFGEILYLLENGTSKTRAAPRSNFARPRLTWRLVFLSNGERGLASIMNEAGKPVKAGQEVRLLEIPADAGAGFGLFEELHGHAGGAQFSDHLRTQTERLYGAVGQAWLEHLTESVDTLHREVRESVGRITRELLPPNPGGQVERAAARFALLATAGEMATRVGLTGWASGEATQAIHACFAAWLKSRGGSGNGEIIAMLRQVRRYLEENAEGKFTLWHRAADDHAPKTLLRAGVRRMLNADGEPIKTDNQHGVEFGNRMPAALGENVSYEYFILNETFRSVVCAGFDHSTVAKVLHDHGCLKTTEPGRWSVKTRLPGIGPARCYQVTPKIFELDL